MKKILIISIITFIALNSCDEKIGALKRVNLAPSIVMYTLSEEDWFSPEAAVYDTGKVSNSESGLVYSIGLRLSDRNKNYENIRFSNHSGGIFFVNGQAIEGNSITVGTDSLNLAYMSSTPGDHHFVLLAKDDFGKENLIPVELFLISNAAPIANLEITHRNILNKNEYALDARNSFDQDKKYGGRIILYEFEINNVKINSKFGLLNHVFSSGNHIIKLRVQDNDFTWSETLTRKIDTQ